MRITRRRDYTPIAHALVLHRAGSLKYTGSTRHDLDSVYRGMTHAAALLTGCHRQSLVDLIELLLEENPQPMVKRSHDRRDELSTVWLAWVDDMTRRVSGWLS